jgi:hypothetical protein
VTTVRYRAESSVSYARAVITLCEYARGSFDDFDFGPDSIEQLHREGLIVTGPDLEMVERLLEKVPGLYRSDE